MSSKQVNWKKVGKTISQKIKKIKTIQPNKTPRKAIKNHFAEATAASKARLAAAKATQT
jgi:hypothetical protein